MAGNGLPITPCACQIRQMLLTNPSLVSPQVQVRDILGYSLPVLLMDETSQTCARTRGLKHAPKRKLLRMKKQTKKLCDEEREIDPACHPFLSQPTGIYVILPVLVLYTRTCIYVHVLYSTGYIVRCTCTCLYVYVQVYIYTCTCTCTCLYVHVHVYMYMCYILLDISLDVYIHVYMYMYKCIYIHVHVHVHVYMYMYMYICTCIYMYVHVKYGFQYRTQMKLDKLLDSSCCLVSVYIKYMIIHIINSVV